VRLELPDELVDQVAEAVASRIMARLEALADRSPWMDRAQARVYTGLPKGTFDKLVASGEIPSRGGRLFHRELVDEALGYAGPAAVARPPTRLRRRVDAA